MNSNIQNIKDRLNTSLNRLVEIEEYEHCQKVKTLIDKIKYFESLRDTIKDQGLYKEVEQLVIDEFKR